MTQQRWTPADICKGLSSLGASQPHLNTRVKAKLVEPATRGKGQGSKNYYDAHGIMLYCLATKIENTGADMKAAYVLANEILDYFFDNCLKKDEHPYIVMFIGNNKEGRTVLHSSPLPEYMNKDNFLELKPLPGVTIFVAKTFMIQIATDIGRPEYISFMNAGFMVQDCIERLCLNEDSIETLKKRSEEISKIETSKILDERDDLMNQYETLLKISFILPRDSEGYRDIEKTMQSIREKLKM